MNKFFVFLSALLVVFAVSCSSDDGGNGSGGSDDDGSGSIDKSANLLATGASANDILSNTNFDRMVIEIGHVIGFNPTQTAIDNFQDYIRQHTFKDDIEIILSPLQSPNENTFSLQEIADLEEENRTQYNDGSTLAVYIFFADAPSDQDDTDGGVFTLGAVYRNTSMVIYEETVRNLASNSALISIADAETATLNHEFGHLFGLVNIGTVPVNDHEDPEAENHCVIDGCLMQAQLQFTVSGKNALSAQKQADLHSACSLSGSSLIKIMEQQMAKGLAGVPDLDAECVLDLQNNGGR